MPVTTVHRKPPDVTPVLITIAAAQSAWFVKYLFRAMPHNFPYAITTGPKRNWSHLVTGHCQQNGCLKGKLFDRNATFSLKNEVETKNKALYRNSK